MKTNKELAVELTCACIRELINHSDRDLPSPEDVKMFMQQCYDIVSAIPDDDR